MDSDISQVVPQIAAEEIRAQGGAAELNSADQFAALSAQATAQGLSNKLAAADINSYIANLTKQPAGRSPADDAAAAGQLTPGELKLQSLLEDLKKDVASLKADKVDASAIAAAPDGAGGGSQAPPFVAAAPADGDKAKMDGDMAMKNGDKAMYGDMAMKDGDKAMMDKPMSSEDKAKLGEVVQKNAEEMGKDAEAVGASASKNIQEEGSASSDDISEPMAKALEVAGNMPKSAEPSAGNKSSGEQSYGSVKDQAAANGTTKNESQFLATYAKKLGIEDKAPPPDPGQLLMNLFADAMKDGKLTKEELILLAKVAGSMGGNTGPMTQDKLFKMIEEAFMGAEAGDKNNDLSPEAMMFLDKLVAMIGAPGGGGDGASASGGDSADSGSDGGASAGSGRSQTTRAPLAAGGGITGGNILASLYGSYLGGDEVSRLQKVLSGEDAADPLSGTATA
jgi:hypothetical protein